MPYLFSKLGLRGIKPFLQEATLLAFDFDGTLAPIVSVPGKASLPATTARRLEKLSRLAPVALISGRGVTDLKSRIAFPLKAWIGNHGMEGLPGRAKASRDAKKIIRAWGHDLIEKLAGLEGVLLENKGYSITLHYRASHRRARTQKILLDLVSTLEPAPNILPGKCVLNLLVPGHIHKGNALVTLMEQKRFSQAIFVGDDDTDEEVFRLRDPRIFSIRVGRKRGSAAQTYLKNQKEVQSLLNLLLHRHGRNV